MSLNLFYTHLYLFTIQVLENIQNILFITNKLAYKFGIVYTELSWSSLLLLKYKENQMGKKFEQEAKDLLQVIGGKENATAVTTVRHDALCSRRRKEANVMASSSRFQPSKGILQMRVNFSDYWGMTPIL